jgi:parallel beta-helix repeat protein
VGISVVNSTSATILQARAMGNTEEGIKVSRSPRSVLNNNIASGNRWGIRASGSDGTMVVRSHLSENRDAGLALLQLSAATVAGSSAFDNGDGVFLQAVVGAKIEGNNLSNNRRYGLRMSYSRDGKVYGNTFVENGLGGTGLVDCTGCIIRHNNFIDNGNPMSPQNAVDNGDNSWDGGAEVGGNFWSDHQVTGNPGSDPKTVPTRGVDRYPFQDPDGWRKK